ncbi:dsDNA nuclease domain-containing protein, partial [Clostridioides difficile]
MSKIEYYMNLPYDLSGSMSKNRFRNELLWGLKKMYELYKTNEDFVVVFDYRCDIEVHLENKFEFYQVKTQNNSGTYTINKLTDKKKGSKSVVGNLYSLKYDINMNEIDDVYVAIVSNAPLNDGKKTYNNSHEVKIKTIDSSAIEKIKLSIKNDLN